MKDLGHIVDDFRREAERLARIADRQYAIEVEDILNCRCIERERIELILDRLLDFCFDPAALHLFRRLCRY